MPPRTRTPRSRAVEAEPQVLSPTEPVVGDVVAVLVAHDGAEWLPEVLSQLAASTVRPLAVVGVDTGSADGSAALLAAATDRLVQLPRNSGYGAAVAAGLAAAPASRWVWLLHDDAAVEPDTLAQLLAAAEAHPQAALLGPKVRDWTDPRVLVEVGLTVDAGGHRDTGLERREYDQGQHDTVREVLAVGTAGALARRDAWTALGGLDPQLPLFRDELDLGWRLNSAGHQVLVVPAARMRHVRAATTGRRSIDAVSGPVAGVDRRHALYLLAVNAPPGRLALVLLRLAVAVVVRAAGFLLTRQPGAARDELVAFGHLVAEPNRLLSARRTRAATRARPPVQVRLLLTSRTARLRARAEAAAHWLSGGAAPAADPSVPIGDPGPEGPEALDDLQIGGTGFVRRQLSRPGVLLVGALAAITLLAERHLLRGPLVGGRLLPVPGGASDLWRGYLASWHPVGVGTGAAAPPFLAGFALLSGVFLGKPWLALLVLLLLSVPVAGLGAYLCARRVVRQLPLQLWAAVTWALLPVATETVAGGRLDGAAVQVGLPWLALGTARVVARDPKRFGWWPAWALGLGLSVVVAFAPPLWPVAAVLLVGTAILTVARGGDDAAPRRAAATALAAAVPLLVLLPWSIRALATPGQLFAGPGVGLPVALPSSWQLLLLSPGGPATPARWVTLGLLAAAAAGAWRDRRAALVRFAWSVAGVALVFAALESRGHWQQPGAAPTPLWAGVACQVAAAGLLVSALVAGDRAEARLARHSFGWRHVLVAVTTVLAAAGLVTAVGQWVLRGADGPVHRLKTATLPAFARVELSTTPGERALILRPHAKGAVGYELVQGDLPTLGEADLLPRRRQRTALAAVVADLLTPSGSDAAGALGTRSVRYVALTSGPGSAALAGVLDGQPGLSRRAAGAVTLWEVAAPASRLTLLGPAAAARARSGARAPSPVAGDAGAEPVSHRIATGPAGRLLVLSEATDASWRATLNGHPLARRTAWGWAQGFLLPAAGGEVRVWQVRWPREFALWLELAATLVVLVLAAPARRRRGIDAEDDEELPV